MTNNPIQAVPNGKVKASMKISNKGDMRVALKELDLLSPSRASLLRGGAGKNRLLVPIRK